MQNFNRADELLEIAKDFGLEKMCKGITDDTAISGATSEHEFTAMVDGIAKSQGTTFVKMFSAQDDVGLALRKAHAATNAHPQRQKSYLNGYPVEKAAPYATLTPRVSGGRDAQAVNDPVDAMAKLNELTAELRRADPELSSHKPSHGFFQTRISARSPKLRDGPMAASVSFRFMPPGPDGA